MAAGSSASGAIIEGGTNSAVPAGGNSQQHQQQQQQQGTRHRRKPSSGLPDVIEETHAPSTPPGTEDNSNNRSRASTESPAFGSTYVWWRGWNRWIGKQEWLASISAHQVGSYVLYVVWIFVCFDNVLFSSVIEFILASEFFLGMFPLFILSNSWCKQGVSCAHEQVIIRVFLASSFKLMLQMPMRYPILSSTPSIKCHSWYHLCVAAVLAWTKGKIGRKEVEMPWTMET